MLSHIPRIPQTSYGLRHAENPYPNTRLIPTNAGFLA